MYDRITAATLGQIAGTKPGQGYCARCGREMKVRPEVPLHVCVSCRKDREWMRLIAEKMAP
jgi:hypothetical protein